MSTLPGNEAKFGVATYKSYRFGDLVTVVAEGNAPCMNTKVFLKVLPMMIFPPVLGLFFEDPEICLPAMRPFKVLFETKLPSSVKIITVRDRDGSHKVPIESFEFPPSFAALDSATGDIVTGTSAVSIQGAVDDGINQFQASNPTEPGSVVVFDVIRSGAVEWPSIDYMFYFARVQRIINS